jgi:hypothetical protein
MTRLIDWRDDIDLERVPERFTRLLADALGLDWSYRETHDAAWAGDGAASFVDGQSG